MLSWTNTRSYYGKILMLDLSHLHELPIVKRQNAVGWGEAPRVLLTPQWSAKSQKVKNPVSEISK